MENSFQKEQMERMQEQLKAIHKAIMDRAGTMDAERVYLLTKAQLRIIRTLDFINVRGEEKENRPRTRTVAQKTEETYPVFKMEE